LDYISAAHWVAWRERRRVKWKDDMLVEAKVGSMDALKAAGMVAYSVEWMDAP
jgi:hypothetical protein